MTGIKTIEVTLIRHGLTTANEEHILAGWQNAMLSKAGIQQLKEYKNAVNYPTVQRFYCSDLSRAVDTFDLLFSDNYTIYRKLSGLREVNFGINDGMSAKQNQETGFYQHWLNNERVEDEENFEEFRQRVMKAFNEIIEESIQDNLDKIGIVLHEGSIKCILLTLENRGLSDYLNLRFANGLGVTLTLEYHQDNAENPLHLAKKELIRKQNALSAVFIRHGISVANEKKLFAGLTDYDLGESGIKQLEEYRNTFFYPVADRFYCSPLLRARRTFEILYPNLKIEECLDDFKEGDYGEYENTPVGPLTKEFFKKWTADIIMGKEESRDIFDKRVMHGLEYAYHQTQQAQLFSFGIVAHAGVLKALLLNLCQKPYSEWSNIKVENGRGYLLEIEYIDGKPILLSMDLI